MRGYEKAVPYQQQHEVPGLQPAEPRRAFLVDFGRPAGLRRCRSAARLTTIFVRFFACRRWRRFSSAVANMLPSLSLDEVGSMAGSGDSLR